MSVGALDSDIMSAGLRTPSAAAAEPVSGGATTWTLEDLFTSHAADVYRTVARLLGPSAAAADIEDLVQEVFIAALRGLARFRGDSKPSTWLYGIACRIVLTHLRARGRLRRFLSAFDARPRPESVPSPQARLEVRDELREVWRALAEVPPKKRIVYVLHELEGVSGPDIARALEIPEATVWTRLHHARKALMEQLGRPTRRASS